MIKYGYKYRVEVTHFTRGRFDGDWYTKMYWLNFDDLEAAIDAVKNPKMDPKDITETRLYDMKDNRDLIYSKDWINGEVKNYITNPDFDYHNREYEQ